MDKVRLAATKILYDISANGAWANVSLAQTLRREKFGMELDGAVKAVATH